MATTKFNSTKKKTTRTKASTKKSTPKKTASARTSARSASTKAKKPAPKRTTAKKTSAKKTASKKVRAKASTKKKSVATKPVAVSANETQKRFMRLRKWNIGLAVLHAGQAIAVAYYATDFSLPLRTSHVTLNEATNSLETASSHLVDVPLAWLVVAFFAMSSLAHLIIAGPWFERYKTDLTKGMNRARWIEYSLSASTMMVAIAFLAGVNSLSLMVAIFGLTAIMNLMGLVMEVHAQDTKGKPSWLAYWIGALAGILPWLIVGIYFVSNWFNSTSAPPTFVYIIYASIFLAFNSFALNMYLQYKKKGKWVDYLYGEKVYMVLSLVAKSALAWQVFGGTLRP